MTNGNVAECAIGNGFSGNTVRSTGGLTLGSLNHLACVWTGTQVQLYVNGLLNATTPQSMTPLANSSPLYIGQYGGNTDRTNGVVDEVRIYSRSLTQAEIQSDMASPITAPTADTTNPTASVTAPAGAAVVSGSVQVTANAADNVGVAGVQFRLDGNDLGAEDTAAPYTVAWDTRTAANGSHPLSAVARDAAGNRGRPRPSPSRSTTTRPHRARPRA